MFESFKIYLKRINRVRKEVFLSIGRRGLGAQLKTALAIFLQTLATGSNLATIYILGHALHDISERDNNDDGDADVASDLTYSALTLAANVIFISSSRLITSSIKSEYAAEVNSRIIRKYSELDVNFTLTTPLGAFVRMIQYVYETQEAVPLLIDEIWPTYLEIFLANIALFVFDWEVAGIFLATQIASFIGVFLGTKSTTGLYLSHNEEGLRVFGKIISRIQNHENIKLYGIVEREIKEGIADLENYNESFIKLAKLPEKNGLAQGVLAIAASFGVIIFASNQDRLPFNYFSILLIYLFQLYKLWNRASTSISRLLICEAGMAYIDGFMHIPIGVPEIKNPNSLNISSATSSVDFENVCFRYDDEVILNKFSVSVPAGSKLAIVGLSGSGKSTLARLLLRLYLPDSGTIKIGKTDINSIRTETLHKVIGLVPQHPRFSNETLAAVLREAKEKASDQELIDMLKKVRLEKFATKENLNKILGEGGAKLSGGQMQRLAIARALLKDPYILIFDEATSALDMETAYEVIAAVNEEIVGITTIVITHNVLSVSDADHIIVLDNGMIVDEGSFDELKENKQGRFYGLLEKFFKINGLDPQGIQLLRKNSALESKKQPPRREFKEAKSSNDNDQKLDIGPDFPYSHQPKSQNLEVGRSFSYNSFLSSSSKRQRSSSSPKNSKKSSEVDADFGQSLIEGPNKVSFLSNLFNPRPPAADKARLLQSNPSSLDASL